MPLKFLTVKITKTIWGENLVEISSDAKECPSASSANRLLLPGLAFLLLLLVFFKNAWVCDDAYLNFRALEQLFAGNGPNWNPNQRVQVYTSPLWFWLLAIPRLVSTDHFFNVIMLSLLLLLLSAFFLYQNFDRHRAALVFFLFAASNAFVDFSTSGLENILASLLLVVVTTLFLQGKTDDRRLMLGLALLPLCRHDLLTLMLPLAACLAFSCGGSMVRRLGRLFLTLLPLALWSAFSLFYYGALFPNTAYAKLSTGISAAAMIAQGFKYLLVTLQQDPLTVAVIFAAAFFCVRRNQSEFRVVSLALLLNLLYVIWVGGDFMRGRFLTSAFVMAAISLTAQFDAQMLCRRSLCNGAILIYVVYLLLFPYTPLNTGFDYRNFNLEHGIADERGYYFDVCSLYSYLYSKPGEVFPDFEWSHIGRQIATGKVNYLENDFNGMLGYWAGTEAVIVDRLALADPLLARLPVSQHHEWRIGHFKRDVPEEYRRSIETGKNQFPPGPIHDLFELVRKAAIQKDLLSFDRFAAILRLNLMRFWV